MAKASDLLIEDDVNALAIKLLVNRAEIMSLSVGRY